MVLSLLDGGYMGISSVKPPIQNNSFAANNGHGQGGNTGGAPGTGGTGGTGGKGGTDGTGSSYRDRFNKLQSDGLDKSLGIK